MDGTLVYCNTLYNDKFYCNFQLIDSHRIYTVQLVQKSIPLNFALLKAILNKVTGISQRIHVSPLCFYCASQPTQVHRCVSYERKRQKYGCVSEKCCHDRVLEHRDCGIGYAYKRVTQGSLLFYDLDATPNFECKTSSRRRGHKNFLQTMRTCQSC